VLSSRNEKINVPRAEKRGDFLGALEEMIASADIASTAETSG